MNQYLSFFMLLLTLFSFHTGSRAENTSPARKPSIILIPAAFSKASVYDLVKAQLSTAGYETIAIDLPSVGKRAAHVDRTPDIKVVQAALAERLLMGKNVILVGNSYGATVICDAVKDFEDNSSLRRHGLHGKILGLIFFSGFIPMISELKNTRPDIRAISPSWFRFEGTSRVFWDADMAASPPSHTLYNLLSPTAARAAANKLQPSSFAALNATAQYIPYDGKFRSLYVIGAKDNAVTPELAKTYLGQEGAVWEKMTIEGDHTPQLSVPADFVRVVRGFAGEDV